MKTYIVPSKLPSGGPTSMPNPISSCYGAVKASLDLMALYRAADVSIKALESDYALDLHTETEYQARKAGLEERKALIRGHYNDLSKEGN